MNTSNPTHSHRADDHTAADTQGLSATKTPQRQHQTFESKIAAGLKALLTQESPPETLSGGTIVAPDTVVAKLIARGSITQEEQAAVNQAVLSHPKAILLMIALDALLSEEARRLQTVQQIEQRYAALSIPLSEELRDVASAATDDSAERFESLVKGLLRRLDQLENGRVVDLARKLLGDTVRGSLSISVGQAALVTGYTGHNSDVHAQTIPSFSARESLLKAVELGWLEASAQQAIEVAVLSKPNSWRPLYVFSLLQKEFTSRLDRAKYLVSSAEVVGLSAPSKILGAIDATPCTKQAFKNMADEFDNDVRAVQALSQQVTTRWIPQEELEEIHQAGDENRIARAHEIMKECRSLQKIDSIDKLMNEMRTNLLTLTTSSDGQYNHKGSELNEEMIKLFRRLESFNTAQKCSASQRPQLMKALDEMDELAQRIKVARLVMETEQQQQRLARREFEDYLRPF